MYIEVFEFGSGLIYGGGSGCGFDSTGLSGDNFADTKTGNGDGAGYSYNIKYFKPLKYRI